MVDAFVIDYNTSDATGMIPPRLGVGAVTAGIVGTGGRFGVPAFQLPTWIPLQDQLPAQPVPIELKPMSPAETNRLMQLNELHNPMLAELWRGDMNDDLVDSA